MKRGLSPRLTALTSIPFLSSSYIVLELEAWTDTIRLWSLSDMTRLLEPRNATLMRRLLRLMQALWRQRYSEECKRQQVLLTTDLGCAKYNATIVLR